MASNGQGIPNTVGYHARTDVSLCHCEQSEAIKRIKRPRRLIATRPSGRSQ